MVERKIKIKTIEHVKAFGEAVSLCDFQIDLIQGRYTVNGRSLLGIFSLNLFEPMLLVLYTSEKDAEDFLNQIKNMLI